MFLEPKNINVLIEKTQDNDEKNHTKAHHL